MSTFLLDFFATCALVCAAGVVFSHNPIHSIIFLILAFCNTAGLLIALTPRAEFLAIMFLIIYVGAIAVLFLFVVMMLNVRVSLVKGRTFFMSFGLALTSIAAFWWIGRIANEVSVLLTSFTLPFVSIACPPSFTNIQSFSSLYSYYFYFLLLAGLILLVAMIGAIVLTARERERASKKQFVYQQVARGFQHSLFYAS